MAIDTETNTGTFSEPEQVKTYLSENDVQHLRKKGVNEETIDGFKLAEYTRQDVTYFFSQNYTPEEIGLIKKYGFNRKQIYEYARQFEKGLILLAMDYKVKPLDMLEWIKNKLEAIEADTKSYESTNEQEQESQESKGAQGTENSKPIYPNIPANYYPNELDTSNTKTLLESYQAIDDITPAAQEEHRDTCKKFLKHHYSWASKSILTEVLEGYLKFHFKLSGANVKILRLYIDEMVKGQKKANQEANKQTREKEQQKQKEEAQNKASTLTI
jgi:hypothetical protein